MNPRSKQRAHPPQPGHMTPHPVSLATNTEHRASKGGSLSQQISPALIADAGSRVRVRAVPKQDARPKRTRLVGATGF